MLQPATKAATRAALRTCMARMGLLQIDTIHVVARSPCFVLFSRLGAYPQQWLDESLAKGEVFETWVHEACFAPKDDLLAHIRDNGPVKTSDFERVAGWAAAGYVHASQAAVLKKAQANKLEATRTALLSPFAPIVWDRKRPLAMFDFDYRLDAKAHRAQGVFEVKALHTQRDVPWSEAQVLDAALAIQRCADWHATRHVKIVSTRPAKLAAALTSALRTVSHEGSEP